MKRLTFSIIIALALLPAKAQWGWNWGNYPPDNEHVQLTQTNLPIVWITVKGRTIDRYDRITALYNHILNGDEIYVDTSDVNDDGAINAGDVTAVYNIILGN